MKARVSVITNTNLVIDERELSLKSAHPRSECGDYIWLASVLRSEVSKGLLFRGELHRVSKETGDGIILRARNCFETAYQHLYGSFLRESIDFTMAAIRQDQDGQPEEISPIVAAGTTLVINSVPTGADVFIDELFVGVTPVRTTIDPLVSHTVQITRQGYEDSIKLIDPATLKSGSSVNLLYRLQKEE